jgi:hypothetical protein
VRKVKLAFVQKNLPIESMKSNLSLIKHLIPTAAVLFLAGCQTANVNPKFPEMAAPNPALPTAATPADAQGVVRIKAGASAKFTDSKGNVWGPDQGFEGGDMDERPDLEIANTTEPGIYHSEHYSMTSFAYKVANGKYLVKLHFAETFEGITGPGQRVFSFNVQGTDFKDFDVWVKAGGPRRAYVESIPVEVVDGMLKITFTSNIENPEINGIEIIPQS